MAFTTLFFLLLSSSTLTFAFDTSNWTSFFWRRSGSASRNVPPQGYYSPFDNGGNMLTVRSSPIFPLRVLIQAAWFFFFFNSGSCQHVSGRARGAYQHHSFCCVGCQCTGAWRGQRWPHELLAVREVVLSFPPVAANAFDAIRSFGFSGECLGQHSGSQQGANLGDGNGYCE